MVDAHCLFDFFFYFVNQLGVALKFCMFGILTLFDPFLLSVLYHSAPLISTSTL